MVRLDGRVLAEGSVTSRPTHLLVVHPHAMSGDNRGIRQLHVDAVEDLLSDSGEWIVSATDVYDPSFPNAALDADVVVLHMGTEPELEAVIRLRTQLGRPTIYEILDNIVGIGDWLPADTPLRSPLTRQTLLRLASLCDALHVYSPQQAVLFNAVNPAIAVARYFIPVPETLPPKPHGFVMGWGGSRTHRDDLAAIAPVLTEFCRCHSDVTFEYLGDAAMFAELFGGMPSAQVRTWPYSPREEYLRIIRGWHVGLGPMRRTPFNVARSDERFVNYAVSGAAAVLSDEPTFWPHRERALLFRTSEELASILESLHGDRTRVARIAEEAHSWALTERSREVLRNERAAQYRTLIAKPLQDSDWQQTTSRNPAASSRLHAATRAAGAKEFERSLSLCREILAEHPGYQQAAMLAVRNLDALGHCEEALAFAETFDWHPVYRDIASELQHDIARRVRPAEAERFLARIESPLLRMRHEPPSGDRLAQLRRILAHQPFDYFALFGAIKLIERSDAESPELDRLYERACLVWPEGVPDARRPERLRMFLPT
jgi:hypothetical protein